MRCKVFNIPLDSPDAPDVERRLNDFLGATNVKRVFASLANQPQGSMWSILFLCEDGAATPQRSSSRFAAAGPQPAPAGPGTSPDPEGPLTGDQVRSIVALKKWRTDQAAQEGVPLYMVAQNKWLEEIVRTLPRTPDDLKQIAGFGDWRAKKYGPKIIEALTAASASKRSWAGAN